MSRVLSSIFNKSAKIKILFSAIFIVLPHISSAEPATVFSLTADGGVFYGLANEYVYYGGKRISHLEWDEKNTPFARFSAILSLKNFFVRGEALSAFASNSGFIRDYDFLTESGGAVSSYSEHDAHIDFHNIFGLEAGYALTFRNFRFDLSAGFRYNARKWTGSEGFIQYPPYNEPWTGDEPKTSISGAVITYEQKISNLYIRLNCSRQISNQFKIGVTGEFHPYFWVKSLDSHIDRKKQFLDSMQGGYGGSAGLYAQYKPYAASRWNVKAGFSWEKTAEINGSAASRETGLYLEENPFKTVRNYSSGFESFLFIFFAGITFEL
ncbi:MAG: omptin family outer membrane protease [Spirochaetaceae bacterium]|nr:omptin family outer membrane protease [Spirochaetaceae bacterium]